MNGIVALSGKFTERTYYDLIMNQKRKDIEADLNFRVNLMERTILQENVLVQNNYSALTTKKSILCSEIKSECTYHGFYPEKKI